MLTNMNLKEFIKELGSNSPAPGGGSVAALSASLSCALCSMVFNLTIGKKAYREMDEEKRSLIDSSLKEVDSLKDHFLELIDLDAEEFLKLMDAFKMPKDTNEQKSLRDEAIKKGYEKALEVPYNLFIEASKIYDYIEIAAKYGNKNAASDAGVSALMLQSAIEAAILNVKINLSSIDDITRGEEIKKLCNSHIEKGRERRDIILKIVEEKM